MPAFPWVIHFPKNMFEFATYLESKLGSNCKPMRDRNRVLRMPTFDEDSNDCLQIAYYSFKTDQI